MNTLVRIRKEDIKTMIRGLNLEAAYDLQSEDELEEFVENYEVTGHQIELVINDEMYDDSFLWVVNDDGSDAIVLNGKFYQNGFYGDVFEINF